MGVGTSFTLRPAVPMGHMTGVPHVCALGIARELEARVRWPHEVVGRDGFKDFAYFMLAGFAIGGAGLGVIGSNLFIRRHLKV